MLSLRGFRLLSRNLPRQVDPVLVDPFLMTDTLLYSHTFSDFFKTPFGLNIALIGGNFSVATYFLPYYFKENANKNEPEDFGLMDVLNGYPGPPMLLPYFGIELPGLALTLPVLALCFHYHGFLYWWYPFCTPTVYRVKSLKLVNRGKLIHIEGWTLGKDSSHYVEIGQIRPKSQSRDRSLQFTIVGLPQTFVLLSSGRIHDLKALNYALNLKLPIKS